MPATRLTKAFLFLVSKHRFADFFHHLQSLDPFVKIFLVHACNSPTVSIANRSIGLTIEDKIINTRFYWYCKPGLQYRYRWLHATYCNTALAIASFSNHPRSPVGVDHVHSNQWTNLDWNSSSFLWQARWTRRQSDIQNIHGWIPCHDFGQNGTMCLMGPPVPSHPVVGAFSCRSFSAPVTTRYLDYLA